MFIALVIQGATMIGYLDANGDPHLEIDVANPLGWKSKLKCLIDTGFTGFLSVPILDAFPIGLLLVGTLPVTLADGRVQNKLMCLGNASVGAEAHVGVILIEPGSSQTLLGMEFFRVFKKRLIVDPIAGIVELVDSAGTGPPTGSVPLSSLLPPTSPTSSK